MKRRTIMVASALSALMLAEHAQAGFLDDFARAFLGQTSRPVVTYEPLEMTVKKQRRRPVQPIERSSRPTQIVKLDPFTDPGWYLRDPTLRRGDIVVTQSGVLVYNGRDSDVLRTADFLELGTGKAGAKSWQNQQDRGQERTQLL
jgi:hypothetical protein